MTVLVCQAAAALALTKPLLQQVIALTNIVSP